MNSHFEFPLWKNSFRWSSFRKRLKISNYFVLNVCYIYRLLNACYRLKIEKYKKTTVRCTTWKASKSLLSPKRKLHLNYHVKLSCPPLCRTTVFSRPNQSPWWTVPTSDTVNGPSPGTRSTNRSEWDKGVDVNPTCLTDEAPTDFECNELLHFTNRVTDRISLKSNLLWSRPEILDVFFDVEVLESHKDRKEKQKISWKVGWVEELGIYCFQTLPSEPGYERKQRLLICNTKEVRFIQTNMSEQVTKKKKKKRYYLLRVEEKGVN